MGITLKTRRRSLHAWLIVCAVVVVLALGVMWSMGGRQQNTSHYHTGTQPTDTVEPVKIVSLTSNNLFSGNIYWGRYINDWSQASTLKTAYPFSRLNEFNHDQYHNWIAGLECPLVSGVHLTSAQEEETLSFNCSPTYLKEAAKWFNVLTLANNHTDNQGAEGFTETKKHLDEHKIQYFGHYDPRSLNDICNIVSLRATATYSDNSQKETKLPIALCGYHGVFRLPSEAALAVMKRYSELMPVIAMPHMGAEYKAEPDDIKRSQYRAMIDNGADIVIGDHPHWVQSTEAYKGKLIVYSMGNFIFDQQFNQEVTRSAAIRVKIDTKGDAGALASWTDIAQSCESYHDDCLDQATKKDLKKLPFTYSYEAIPSINRERLTHPATGADKQGVLNRLRWGQTMQQLAAPHSKL